LEIWLAAWGVAKRTGNLTEFAAEPEILRTMHVGTTGLCALRIPDIAAKSGIVQPEIPMLNGSQCANENHSGSFRQPDIDRSTWLSPSSRDVP
jgi:hypothetical protein